MTRALRLVALSLVVLSCSTLFERSLPGLPGARYEAPADGHCAAEVAFVLFAFTLAWTQQNPTSDLPGALLGFHVEAMSSPWAVDGDLAMGQTLAPDHVRYALRRESGGEVLPLDRTALTHELIHAALWTDTGDPDAAHTSPFFDAWHDDLDARLGAAVGALSFCN